jgi:hypothetical protein
MSAFGGGNYGQEVRVASEQGTGGPSQRPGSGDKRSVLLLLAGLVAFAGLVALVAR